MDTTPITRRRLLQAWGLAGVGAVAACAAPGSGGQAPGGGPAGRAIPTGPVEGEVSFAHWRAEDKEVFDKLIAQFAKATPNVTVTQDISPSNDYQTSALQRIRSGDVGDAFVAFRGAQFADMVKAGIYQPLGGQSLVDDYQPSLVESGRKTGIQYGMPYQLVFNMPIVNTDLIDKVGGEVQPPDWDGWLGLCEKIKSAGIVPLAWPGGDVGNAGQLLNEMVMNNAPSDDMFAKIESGDYKCTDDWFVTTLKQYAQLRPYFQENATGTAAEPAQQLFSQGKAAMLATGSYHMAAVRALGAKFPMDVTAPITVSAAKAKYQGVYNATFVLGVNARSDVQPAALAWIAFLSQPENAGTYANGTSQHVTVADVEYTDRDLKATAPWLTKKTLLAPRFQFLDLDLRNAVENSAIQVVGGKQPEQAAEEAQKIVDQRRAVAS